jgi:hypothetical protein
MCQGLTSAKELNCAHSLTALIYFTAESLGEIVGWWRSEIQGLTTKALSKYMYILYY